MAGSSAAERIKTPRDAARDVTILRAIREAISAATLALNLTNEGGVAGTFRLLRNVTHVRVDGLGHPLHAIQPARMAELFEAFLTGDRRSIEGLEQVASTGGVRTRLRPESGCKRGG